MSTISPPLKPLSTLGRYPLILMLILKGAKALSVSRKAKLLTELAGIESRIGDIDAQFVYFVETNKQFSGSDLRSESAPESLQKLQAILEASTYELEEIAANQLLVTPRLGTISPWSSKATEILRRCGLDLVERVERGVLYEISGFSDLSPSLRELLFDRMTESAIQQRSELEAIFSHASPKPLSDLQVLERGVDALREVDQQLGLALAEDEMQYLINSYRDLGREPTDIELMMFAQANSEHCRHKIFNASWTIDGVDQAQSLFDMIRNTNNRGGQGVLSAYSDNAAVVEGSYAARFYPDGESGSYTYSEEPVHLLMKVETHNHPTAISPFAGAGTGSGGEIRDEGAVGRGSKPKVGLCGFSVSNLRIPGFEQPWETEDYGKPERIVNAYSIMLEGPIGAAAFNNEFGRPNLCGYFRSFEMDYEGQRRGYHKPIMIAGGYGNIREEHVDKPPFEAGCNLIVLGGPAMLIGLGGGAASSMTTGSSSEDLDFASVQRQNPEMQRRCQEAIDSCWALGSDNPIAFIHDVGAGGLSNALPELVKDGGTGGKFELRAVNTAEPGMSPMEIWCNESQERYVLAVSDDQLPRFQAICKRERAPYAIVGRSIEEKTLQVEDKVFSNKPVDLPMSILFGKPPKMHRQVTALATKPSSFDSLGIELNDAINRVLRHPTVASKSFLITIGDRSITGMVARDQMVGPWQVPVSDVAVTTTGFKGFSGEAMSMGERTPLALIDAPASGRMAIGEAITNIAGTAIGDLNKVRLSANWMCATGHAGEDEKLYRTVEAVGMELCPELDITIPVGKDSMSMRTAWTEEPEGFEDGATREKSVTSPTSLIISAFAPVLDVRKTLTPQIDPNIDSELWLVDLASGANRLGGSILGQVYNQIKGASPNLENAQSLSGFFRAMQQSLQEGLLQAYHDRSDGGLISTLLEMAFAGRCGLTLDMHGEDVLSALFSEELGAVIQVPSTNQNRVREIFAEQGLAENILSIGQATASENIQLNWNSQPAFTGSRGDLQKVWAETSYRLQAERDNSDCAAQEFAAITEENPGFSSILTYNPAEDIAAPYLKVGVRPRLAILREQGVNGQLEMAAAFDAAGFDAVDVHMTDLLSGRYSLNQFKALVACGGFSYGDVLGAGRGWATSILFNPALRDQFATFFARKDTFALGICNGCQMMSALSELIPGAENWPRFVHNQSEQFEARVSLVRVEQSDSILLAGMQGSILPVAVAHGEGQVAFASEQCRQQVTAAKQVALSFVDNFHQVTEKYPANPNGSVQGITSLTNEDGRVTIMMPHPERVFRTVTNSWHPDDWPNEGPWMRMFRNARSWVN